MRVYQYTTRDKFRLPLYQADTLEELAALVGVNRYTAAKMFRRALTGKTKNSRWTYVDIPDDEEDE